MASKEKVILQLLRDGERYGLQLVEESGGRLKRGTVYVTLGRMEEKGYLHSRLEERAGEEGGLPRRLYRPTALGRRVLEAWVLVGRKLAFGGAR